MKIKIAHLYYDLMNLYGENGNVRCLKKHLENQGFNVDIDYLTINDKIDFDKYDVFYIGCGNKNSFLLALEDIKNYKNEIKKIIDDKFIIATGNALNLFGKCYKIKNEIKECLGILDFESVEIRKRVVKEQLYKSVLNKNEIIGFENRFYKMVNNNENILFTSIDEKEVDGIIHKNFYGTYLLGPILIRNFYFTDYVVKQICNKFNKPYKEYKDEIEIKAYNNYKEQI